MLTIKEAEQFWDDVRRRISSTSAGAHHLEKCKTRYLKAAFEGESVASVEGGLSYARAVDMVVAEIEEHALRERLQRAEELKNIKTREFYLALLEETGVEPKGDQAFDPTTLTVRVLSACRAGGSSYRATLDGLTELIKTALVSPLAAGRMSQDQCLPPWLQQLGGALVSGNLRPHLRCLLEECLADFDAAGKAYSVAEESHMPQFLVDALAVIAGRADVRI